MNDTSMIKIATEEDIDLLMATKRETNRCSLKERMTEHLQLHMSSNLHREVVTRQFSPFRSHESYDSEGFLGKKEVKVMRFGFLR